MPLMAWGSVIDLEYFSTTLNVTKKIEFDNFRFVIVNIMSNTRSNRLAQGRTVTLYHQTGRYEAAMIMQSQRMLRGSAGLAGGGIYFATSKSATDGKAYRLGAYLKAEVKLGYIYRVGPGGDTSLSFERLQMAGYDSVRIDRPGGTEYVVYNHDQVTDIRISPLANGDLYYLDSAEPTTIINFNGNFNGSNNTFHSLY